MTAFLFPFSQYSIYICSASTLTEPKTQSQQTNKFPFPQVEVSAFSKVKRKCFSPPPKLPYLWRAERWCVYLKLSWLWNSGVFIGVSMREECSYFKHIHNMCICVLCCTFVLCWLTMSDTMMCNMLCWWWEGRGSRITGWLTHVVWTSQTSHLLPSFLSLLFPGLRYNFHILPISFKNL